MASGECAWPDVRQCAMLLQHAFDCGTGDVWYPARPLVIRRAASGCAAPLGVGGPQVPHPSRRQKNPSRAPGLRRSRAKLQEHEGVPQLQAAPVRSRTRVQLAHPGRIGRERLGTTAARRILRFHPKREAARAPRSRFARRRQPAHPMNRAPAPGGEPRKPRLEESRNSWW